MNTPRLMLAAAAFGLLTPFAQGAPFSNGSFEDPGVSTGTEEPFLVGNSPVSGWTGTGTGLRYLKNGNSHPGASAVEGTHLVSFGHGGAVGDELAQTFDTVPGKGYAVNFWFTAIDSETDDFQLMTVEAFDGATSLANPEWQFLPWVGGQWSQGKTYSFTATSTSTRLVFTDVTSPIGGGETGNWALDGVTVTEIAYAPGTVLAWGTGSETEVPAGLANVQAIAAGQSHALALKSDGSVVGWGANGLGQRTVPGTLGAVKAIAAYGNHSLALLEDGTLQGWGEDYGNRMPPAGLSDVIGIAEGFYFSAALRSNGTVVVWGDFEMYGNPANFSPPAGLTGVKAIAAGYDHILALKEDGSVVAWGVDELGQATVPPEAATGVKAIAAGSLCSFAIKEDGAVIAWGEFQPLPDGLENVTAIAAGEAHWLALKNDGSVVGWGDPTSGQLILPPGLANVSQIGAGLTFSMALTQPLDALPDPLEFSVITADPGASWEFTAKFPDQTGLYLRVQSAPAPPQGETIDESSWTDLPGGGMMELLDDGDEENWRLATSDLPFGLQYFRVIAAAPGFADSKLVFAVPLRVESPAGAILYTQGSGLNRNLMLMESDGSNQVALTDGTLNPLQCALSPGGIRAAFVTLAGELYVMKALPMDAVENVPVNVLDGASVTASFSSTMAWSPDGLWLAFAGDDNKIYVLKVIGEAAEITPYDGTTNPLTAVVDTLSSAPNPAWSPDGKHLALLGANHIQVFQIMDGAGAITPQGPGNPLVALTLVSDSATAKTSASWSPDGQDLAFVEENVVHSTSFISILHARNGVGVLTPEEEGNERVPLYEATDTPLAETVSWSRDGSLLAVGAKDGFVNYVEVFKPELVDELNERIPLTVGNLEDGAFGPSFGGGVVSAPPPDDDLPASTDFQIVRGMPGLPWTFSILQTSTIPGLTLRVESTLTPDEEGSWEDLPGGSLMERDGDLWTLLSSEVPFGNRYFRVVAEVDGFPPQIAALDTPYLIEREVVDHTPPTLAITHAWIEKLNGKNHYRMYLDPRDETGFDAMETIFVRTGADVAKLQPFWRQMPWTRGQPITELFTGASITIEVYAQDAAGNKSTVQRRVFKSPLPVTAAPNTEPRFAGIIPFAENAIDCRGLFAGDFDGMGVGDDVLQIDRGSGEVRVRRQGDGGAFADNSFFLTPNGIADSAVADLNGDGRPDLVVVVDAGVKVFYNQGVDGDDVLQFTEDIPAGLSNIALPTVAHCAVGDVTGEGKPDIVLTGSTGPGDAVVAVLVNDDDGELTAATAIAAGPGLTAGLIKLGDVDGDGWLDAVMVDAPGNQLVTFRNKGEGELAGYVEPDPEYQPKKVATGHQTSPLPPQALAVGDVTGDGRADAVVVMHWFVSTNETDPNDTRDHQVWQLLDALPDGSLHANELFAISEGPQAASGTDYRSDVLLQDLNGDRFPELIFTSQFEEALVGGSSKGGILAIRVNSQLDALNKLLTFDITETPVLTDAANPHRLAAGRYGRDTRKGVILANGANPQLQWIPSGFSISTKAQDLVGGLETQSDPDGTEVANGVRSYFEYPGGYIDFSITYANNTVNPFTNATIESQLPVSLELIPAETDPGYVLAGAAASRVIRWTETIPAGSAGVKHFRARVLSTAKPGASISPKLTFKGGGKTLTASMPKVKVDEPLVFEWGPVVSSSDSSGLQVRFDETIFYRMKATNRGPAPIMNTLISMALPAGTRFEGPVSAIDGVTYTPPTQDTKVLTFTVTQLNAEASTVDQLIAFVTVRALKGQVKATMTAQRPGGLKRTLPTWVTEISPSLGIKIQADKSISRPGEVIEYTVTAKNWGSEKVTSARVVNVIPFGTTLVGARLIQGSGNYIGANEDATVLNEDTQNGDRPGYVRGATPHLFWDLEEIPGGEERQMKYTVIVGADVPTEYYPGGKYTGVEIVNNQYNISGVSPSGIRIFAFPPANAAAAAKAGAAAVSLLAKTPAPSIRTLMSAQNPLAVPKLTLQKTAVGPRDESITKPLDDAWKYRLLESEMDGKHPKYFLINDPLNANDGRLTFMLSVTNTGTATAHNIFAHDILPAGLLYDGKLGRDGDLTPGDAALSHFYDSAGKEIPAGSEAFSDNNGNGRWDKGETFTDSNGNKKYDGITSCRSFDFWVGDLVPGASRTIYYQVLTDQAPGKSMVSSGGGIAGVIPEPKGLNGLNYTAKNGFYVRAQELHFPVNGQPEQLQISVGASLVTTYPVPALISRSNIEDNQKVEIRIPYQVGGWEDLAFNGKMEFTIPRGYAVLSAQLLDANLQEQEVLITQTSTAAGRKVSIPLNGLRYAWPTVQIGYDRADTVGFNKLLDKKGQTINPLRFFATVTGGFFASAPTVAGKFGVPLDAQTMSGNVAAASEEVVVGARADTAKDSAVFVGRVAPIFVRRGQTFDYTIFVGNQTNTKLGEGVISMKVPPGCVAKKATRYRANGLHQSPTTGTNEIAGTYGKDITPPGTKDDVTFFKEVTWKTPKPAGTLISWPINEFIGSEGGAVTLTVEVSKDFTGNRIEDETCWFRVENAMDKSAGLLSVVVLPGNEETQSAEVVQRVIEGVGARYSAAGANALTQNLTLGANSSTIGIGGANLVHLEDGTLIIPMPENRVMVLGTQQKVVDYEAAEVDEFGRTHMRMVIDTPALRIAVGPGTISDKEGDGVLVPDGIMIVDPPGYGGSVPVNKILRQLGKPGVSLTGKRKAKIMLAGGTTLGRAGADTFAAGALSGPSGPKVQLPAEVAGSQLDEKSVKELMDSAVIFNDTANIVAAGGGNIVAAGGGNIVAAGGGNIVAAGGGNAVAKFDSAGRVLSHNGNAIVAAGGGNIVAAGGGNIVAAGGGNIVAAGGGNIVAAGGGN